MRASQTQTLGGGAPVPLLDAHCMVVSSLRSSVSAIPHRLVFALHTMSFKPAFNYIQDAELAKLWKLKASRQGDKSVAVVDVRDDDFEGGNIPGCVHVPSNEFPDKVRELVLGPLKDGERASVTHAWRILSDPLEATVQQVVFHCSLSQAR